MKRLNQVLDLTFKKLTKEDYDSVIILTGDEGSGKSNLLLHIIEYWYNKLNGDVVADDIKHVALDISQFSEDLKDCVKYEATAYDEAGDISSKRSMSKMNVLLTQAYQVIRGDNLLTIFVLPSVFDIDGFFAKRRARCLIHVFKRGRFMFFGKRKLQKIIEINQNRIVKRLNLTPNFFDTFPKYKGILLQPYLTKKKEKMSKIRQDLYDSLKDLSDKKDNVVSIKDIEIYNYWLQNGTSVTAVKYNKSVRQVQRIVKPMRQATSDKDTYINGK